MPTATSPATTFAADLKGKRAYVVDAHSLIFQVFHALPEMTSPRGEHVGAVYGFTRDILYLLDTKQPDFLICAFDSPGLTFRHDVYEAYKADRSEMPADLVSQIPKIYQVLAGLGVPVIALTGYEADDILATLARECDEAGAHCLLVSGDKDCRQLISDHVAIYNIRKDEVFDAAALRSEWGVRPEQVVDFQALVGDKVDNVPGVPLIGPKIAGELLAQYGTLEAVLAHAGDVKGAKRRENLQTYRDQAILSQRLVRLDNRVPIEPDWNAARPGAWDEPRLAELFAEFGFRTFGQRVAGMSPGPAHSAWEAKYTIVDTEESLAELVRSLAQQKVISLDTETTHISPRWAELVGLSFAWKPGEAHYVPLRGPAGDRTLDAAATLTALRPILENPEIKKLGQNLKYDLVVLRGAGIRPAGLEFDTMVASYLLDAGERSHNLDDLAQRYLNHTTIKIDELIGRGKQQKRMDQVPVALVGPYAAEDALVPLLLRPLLERRLEEQELANLNEALEVPLIDVLAEMEFTGIRVDPLRLAELSRRYEERISVLACEIEELAGHPLNIASPKQLAEVLFQELRLPVVKRSKTGPSTDASVLEELAEKHPLPAKIVEYRQFAKLRNTYVDALPAMIHPETGRVHASFHQAVAATGRLSSSDPNLQNIPIRTEEGREIRSAFHAGPPGWKLLAADYSQMELRILAHYSRDKALCEAFARDEDVHSTVAAEVYGVAPGEVTPAMRRSAKAVNFGVIYGQSPFGLARALKIEQDEAAAFIESYFARFHGVEDFMLRTLEECRQKGYVSTIMGRRRAIQGIRPPKRTQGSFLETKHTQLNLPERTAVNTVIQGSGADLIKLAMIAIHRRLERERLQANMLLQIHDELLFEAAPDEVAALADCVSQEMRSVFELSVPLKVDVKWGDNWAECEPWFFGDEAADQGTRE